MLLMTLARKAKHALWALLGLELRLKPNITCPTTRLGSTYGGWEVALEPLRADAVVYSFGIGEDASFDLALLEKVGLVVHAFDPTPQSLAWVQRQGFPSSLVVHAVGLADYDGEATFHPPQDPSHVSHTLLSRPGTAARGISVPVQRLTTIMATLGHTHLDLLKMDIEGAEYQVLADLERSAVRPQQLLVEFHHRFPHVGVRQTKNALRRLRRMGYALFAVSASGEELCFIQPTSV